NGAHRDVARSEVEVIVEVGGSTAQLIQNDAIHFLVDPGLLSSQTGAEATQVILIDQIQVAVFSGTNIDVDRVAIVVLQLWQQHTAGGSQIGVSLRLGYAVPHGEVVSHAERAAVRLQLQE